MRNILRIPIVLLAMFAAVSLASCTRKETPRSAQLADGTEIFFRSSSKFTAAPFYPKPREIGVDGEFFFRVPDSGTALTVRSRLLVLKVTGKTAFRIIAYAKEAGEQVEVLYGNIQANKSYPSSYSEPDLLTDGQMTMINRDIDLMEKETADLAELKAWSHSLVEAAAQARQPN